ncbi:SAM-dependent methyltransferase [Spirosoma sp. HMF3257]|uniref:SAM-dependent methyltransferase n=1 Tax=Spirosoma telluris TaxID=2183553 RepID=A0A327NHQ9_9BACT|nr:SAM-dependent methyltransferase [Spirosoma telluris]RAI74707.1 SAM-dependent methyltransferase [Spirosoma telluris]
MFKKLMSKLLPYAVQATYQNYKILSRKYGHYKSASLWQSINKDGQPIPWYSYPMIEYIQQLDCSQKTVFEYGSGNSTLFWASRSKHVVAIEDDPTWYAQIKPKLPANVTYLLVDNKEAYVQAIMQFETPFDVIIVDGSHRYDCTHKARPQLSATGFMILDNSDWFIESAAFLRSTDLIEVDMAGFNPINGYATTTSIFLTRQVSLAPAGDKQPRTAIGGIVQYLDHQ